MVKQVEEPKLHNEDNLEDAESTSVGLNANIIYDPSPPAPAVIPNMPRCMSKFQVLKNLYVMSIAQFLYFLGFIALTNLQSTLNSDGGVGTESLATIYTACIISALLLPKLLIKYIGCKKTLILATAGSIPYVAANFYPSLGTLIPTALLLGLSAGPLITSQQVYTNEIARRYHKYSELESYEVVVARFFGIFYFFSCNTQIWGNFISYYVLRPSVEPILNNSHEEYCGSYFSPDFNETNGTNLNLDYSTEEQRLWLVGIYVSLGVLSVFLMIFFMDPLENDVENDCSTETRCQLVMSRLVAAVKHTMNTNQMLLVPISIFCGIEISFYASEFTQAYIACSWGVHRVGFVSICFGVCGALTSLFVGPLVKCMSQIKVFLLTAVLNVNLYILLFVWKPSPDFPVFYFVFAGIWGMTDAIWWSQVAALYGLMFPNDREAAFSNFMFWGFMGYLMSYSYANYLSVAVKIYIMAIFLVVGIILYMMGQLKIKLYSPRRGYTVIS